MSYPLYINYTGCFNMKMHKMLQINFGFQNFSMPYCIAENIFVGDKFYGFHGLYTKKKLYGCHFILINPRNLTRSP